MKNRLSRPGFNFILILLLQILFVFSACADSGAFNAEVIPSRINQGDAFIIRITGAEDTETPRASLDNRQFYFSSCGKGCFHAIGTVDIETKPGVYHIHLDTGNEKKDLSLTVRRTVFPTINLTLPDKKVFLSPEDQKRADEEAERLKFIWQKISDKLWEGNFIKPLENIVSTGFGVKRIINRKKTSFHLGADIKGKEGDEVRASNRGRVALAEELFFGGNTIVMDHGQGIYSVYMHLSKTQVKPGDIVLKGDIIGLVGSTGRASGPHLHFGIKAGDISTNPVSFFKLKL